MISKGLDHESNRSGQTTAMGYSTSRLPPLPAILPFLLPVASLKSPLSFREAGRKCLKVLNSFFYIICFRKGYTAEQVYLDDGQDNINYNIYNLADGCYINAFRLLNSFVRVLDP